MVFRPLLALAPNLIAGITHVTNGNVAASQLRLSSVAQHRNASLLSGAKFEGLIAALESAWIPKSARSNGFGLTMGVAG